METEHRGTVGIHDHAGGPRDASQRRVPAPWRDPRSRLVRSARGAEGPITPARPTSTAVGTGAL